MKTIFAMRAFTTARSGNGEWQRASLTLLLRLQ